MSALALKDAQHLQNRVLVRRETVSPQTYTDSFHEIRRVFRAFFAPMEFVNVVLDSDPFRYVISTPSGEIELDDLSDGEKAVFTIAFDILRRDLRNSIILIDEPEMHLHPELAAKLADQLPTLRPGNQIWLATQCLEIVRRVKPECVYRLAKIGDGQTSQAKRVFSSADMRETLAQLVGNLGLVTLNKRIVFLEGSDRNIDRYILQTLYADRAEEVEFIPCASVKALTAISDRVMALLEEAAEFNFFYAIRDRDLMTDKEANELEERSAGRLFVWDAYHIENYLLEPGTLIEAARAVCGPKTKFDDADQIMQECKRIAETVVGKLLAWRLDLHFRTSGRRPASNVDPTRPVEHATQIAKEMAVSTGELATEIPTIAAATEDRLKQALRDGSWTRVFPGRWILRGLAGSVGVAYEVLRNAAVDKLSSPPVGIVRVMKQILPA